MVITNSQNTVEKSDGLGQETQFRIRASAKAFRILSSQIYSNKELAVIREYFCNAWDAHVAAGQTERPVEVHLPTMLEPYFSVKDYGTGISHEDMLKIYTTYFESTKNSDNDQIGGLGIGGKAFFSYGDSFMVISRHQGTKRTYTAFISEEDLPSIVLMSEESTDEPNGLEVSGAVAASDFYTFESNARSFFARVTPMPVFSGKVDFAPSPITYSSIRGDKWQMRNGGGRSMAIMGIVAYPIDCDEAQLTPEQKKVMSMPLDIAFGIGEIEVAASREKLSFTKGSIENLKKRLDEIHDELLLTVSARFDNCPNLWSAKVMLWSLYHGDLTAFRPIIDVSGILWKGQKVTFQDIQLGGADGLMSSTRCYLRKQTMKRESDSYKVSPSKRVKFFINDLPTGSISRVRYLLKTDYDMREGSVMVFELLDPLDQAGIIKALGMDGETLQYTSSLPKPPRGVYSASDKGKAQILKFDPEAGSRHAISWWDLPDEGFDIEAGGIYVPVDRYQVYNEKPHSYADRKFGNLDALGIDITAVEIYGFKRKVVDKILNNPKWVDLNTYLTGEIKKKLTDPAVGPAMANYQHLEDFGNKYEWVETLQKLIKGDTALKAVVEKRAEMQKMTAKYNEADIWISTAQMNNVAIPVVAPSYDLMQMVEDVLAKYPMLKPLAWAAGQGYATRDIFSQFAAQITQYLEEKPLTQP